MAQIANGIRAILSNPHIYDFFQKIMGADSFRRNFVSDFVRCREGDRILDLGCGTADILAYLPDVDYHGFDISDGYIEAAKKRYGSRGVFQVGLLTEDYLSKIGTFDVVLVLGVLHHLNDDEVRCVFASGKALLKDEGRLVTHDPSYVKNQNTIGRYLISKDRGQNVRYPEEYEILASSSFDHVKCSIKNRLFPTPYTHCFLECTR